MNEDEVLEWLVLQKNSATIEEVTDEILSELIETHEYVVVYFTGDCEEGDKCDTILEDLENIDDELDEAGIIFVTTEELELAKKYNLKNLPKLVFFRNKDPLIYEGDLADEDEVLAWLTDENTLEIPGKIEEVNMKMLEKILAENDHIVVFFCKSNSSNFSVNNINFPQTQKVIKNPKRSSMNSKILMMSVKKRTLISSRQVMKELRRNMTFHHFQPLLSIDTNSVQFTMVTS